MKLKTLGKSGAKFTKLETFPAPVNCKGVKCTTDEVTANCPVTGQPDFYTVIIEYVPRILCVESKTIKLFLGNYRNKGLFCEAFADEICAAFNQTLEPKAIEVTVIQKPRGGVSIHATSYMEKR